MSKLVKMNPDAALEPVAFVDPATVVEGKAVEKGHGYMGDDGEALAVGIWETTAYAEVFSGDGYPEDEFCHVLAGTLTMTDADGTTQTFEQGDNFVVRKGWCGEFRVTEGFKKIYVMPAG
ncbi:MAG: cupin domain-containing protein [Pseudomonadota bacterium]